VLLQIESNGTDEHEGDAPLELRFTVVRSSEYRSAKNVAVEGKAAVEVSNRQGQMADGRHRN
jgi:hypothetical protein